MHYWRIGISGTSNFAPQALIENYFRNLVINHPSDKALWVVTGGCAGMIASFVARLCKAWHIHCELVNTNESVAYDADTFVSFWDGVSKEAQYAIDLAVLAKKHIFIVYPDGNTEEIRC